MLRRLKQQVSDAVNNAVNERTTVDSSVNGTNDEKKGFVCPQCMQTFHSPDELSNHFGTHIEADSAQSPSSIENPNFDPGPYRGRRKSDFDSLPSEKKIEELQAQLKEEQWYSAEIKKELERMNSAIAARNDVPEEEVPYLMQQIQVMEAGKSMVTQRLMELEKEGMALRRAIETEKTEKGDIMAKLKTLTGTVREMTDENEKLKVEKEQTSAEFTSLRSKAQSLEKELVRLNQSLQERPSEDDVRVLKTELVNAQKIMDEIAKEKELQVTEQQNAIRMLSQEREKQHIVIQNLEKALAESGSSSKEHVDLVSSLQSQLSAVQSEKEETEKKLKDTTSKFEEKSKVVEELESKMGKEVEIKKELEEAMERGTREAAIFNESNQSRLNSLNAKLQQLLEERKKMESDLQAMEERSTGQNESIRALEQSNLDLTNEVSSLSAMLDKEKEKLKSKKGELEENEKKKGELEEKIAEMRREGDAVKGQLENVKNDYETLMREHSIARENSEKLRSEISEGESGAKMAMQHLNEEKERIAKEMNVVAQALKEEKEVSAAKQGELEKKMHEMERERGEEKKKWKEELEGMKERLGEAEEEINRKGDRFVEMEKEVEEERRKNNERLNKLKEALQETSKERDEEKSRKEEALENGIRLEKEVKEKERQLGENRTKIEDALKRVTDAEMKARKLEEELKNSAASLVMSNATEKEREAELEEEKKIRMEREEKIEEMNNMVSKLREELDEAKEEARKAKEEMDEKERHWKGKLSEKENVISANEKTNEELIEKEREMEKKVEELENKLHEKAQLLESLNSQTDEEKNRVAEKEKELDEKAKTIASLQESLEVICMEKEDIEKRVKELTENNDELNDKITQLNEKLEEERRRGEEQVELACVREKEAESIVNERESRIEKIQGELDFERAVTMKQKEEILTLEEDIRRKREELDSVEERIKGFEDELSLQRKEVERLEKEKEEKEEEIERVNSTMGECSERNEKEMKELREELVDVRSQWAKEHTELMEARSKLEEISEKLKSLEEEKESIRRECEERTAQLEVEIHKNSEREEEMLKREEELKAEAEKNRRTTESALNDLREMEKKLNGSNETMELLTVKNMELVQAAASWEEEKNALIERCLNTESDLDFERERALENKHRFDEALSAMHELGRANQSLQMDMSKIVGRKWLDDGEALNCASCTKLFSLTVRKHHCRVCGFIFCGPCSSKTVRIASHKNPVRVCHNCFSEVTSR